MYKHQRRRYRKRLPCHAKIVPWNKICINLIGPRKIIVTGNICKFKVLMCIGHVTNLVKLMKIGNKRMENGAEQLNNHGNVNLVQICLQLANLQQKSFPNKWTNAVVRKLTRAGIKQPSELKDYIINKTLNPRLKNGGDSGFHQTTQQGFLDLINGNEDFR